MQTTYARYRYFGPAVAYCLLALLPLCGCGGRSDIGRVSGTVTLEGQPLANARIVFQPQQSGTASYGMTDAEGHYTLQHSNDVEGAVIGRHTVSISTFMAGDPDAEPPQQTSEERVPAKYNAMSELTAEVTGANNTFDFALEAGQLPDWQAIGAGNDRGDD